jgi:adenine specific DNA methylase Mod
MKVLEIREIVNRYKGYKKYEEQLLTNDKKNYIEDCKTIEYDLLKKLAQLKSESPYSFKLACAIDKLILS